MMINAAPLARPNTSPSVRSRPPIGEAAHQRTDPACQQQQHDQADDEHDREGNRIDPGRRAEPLLKLRPDTRQRPDAGENGADPGGEAQYLAHQAAHEGEQGGHGQHAQNNEIDPGHQTATKAGGFIERNTSDAKARS